MGVRKLTFNDAGGSALHGLWCGEVGCGCSAVVAAGVWQAGQAAAGMDRCYNTIE